jgi:exonuclease III
VALQEVHRHEAEDIAQLLSRHTGYSFALAVHSDDVGAGIESDVGIVYNKETLKFSGSSGKVATSPPAGESEPTKTQVFAGFEERLLPLAEPGVPVPAVADVVLASVHFTTGRNWIDPGKFSERAKAWVEDIANRMEQRFPGSAMAAIAGDFNEPRCAGSADPRGVTDFLGPDLVDELDLAPGPNRESITCNERPFWKALSARGFKDSVLAANNTQADLNAQYRNGDWQSGMRIDHVFVKGSQVNDASHDVSCGESDPGAQQEQPRRFRRNCTWLLNAQRYSDHRLVWSLNELGLR